MIERKELNKLVVATLDSSESLKAVQLYDLLRRENGDVLRQDKVKGFRSFVKVLNQFAEIRTEAGTGVKQYTIRKVVNHKV